MSGIFIERESADALQTAMFEDDLFKTDAVLIIENSFLISSTIQKYLTDMKLENVYLSNNGKEGVEYYKKLVSEGKIVPIILGDSLEDIEAKEMVQKLFEIYPRTIIILTSATEKSDKKIIDLLNAGIYDYIQKPLHFDSIKKVIDRIKKERTNDKQDENEDEDIISLLKNRQMISDSNISSILGIQKNETVNKLKKLEQSNTIKHIDIINEPICNRCSSSNIFSRYNCPACSGKSFSKQPLIEHYECGNVSSANEYKDGKCPKCTKELKILGVDYQRLESYYICNNCRDKFSTLVHKLECLSCSNTFEISQANWITSNIYKSRN